MIRSNVPGDGETARSVPSSALGGAIVAGDQNDDKQRGDRTDDEAKAGLILELRSQGVGDRKVLSAIERIPRRLFLSAEHQRFAYHDTALPIECGQTISQPMIVGLMSQALDVKADHRVLEIGTGSGYQAAVLGLLAKEVHTVERYRTLADLARERLETLRLSNVTVHLGDGTQGFPDEAPFDRIIVTAATPEIPPALINQLSAGGKMVLPVGPHSGVQRLVLVEKTDAGLKQTAICDVRFVPLVEGVASRL